MNASRQTLTILLTIGLVWLTIISSAAADRQVGALRQFVPLPAGLGGEGLAIYAGHFYVSTTSFTASDGTILVYNNDGSLMRRLTVPGLPQLGQLAYERHTLVGVGANLMKGEGNLFRIDPESGAITTLATGFKWSNGLAVDRQGNLFVTDLLTGVLSKVTPEGTVSIFASDSLLAPALVPELNLQLGTNDLAFDQEGTALYVTNIGKGTVVKVELREDGTAGAVTNFAKVPEPDGIALDIKGNLYVTSQMTNSIWTVSPDGSSHQLSLDVTHDNLSNPSNLAFQGPELYITNLGFTGSPEVSVTTVDFPGLRLEV